MLKITYMLNIICYFYTNSMLFGGKLAYILKPIFWGVQGNGYVKIMVPSKQNHDSQGRRGSPETSCAAPCAQCFSTLLSEQFLLRSFANLGSKGGPSGGPTKDPQTILSPTFFTLLPLGAPGEPRVAKTLPKTTKMIPKRVPKRLPKDLQMSLTTQGTNLSIGRLTQARWREGHRQVDDIIPL